jgi:hypothetical protein
LLIHKAQHALMPKTTHWQQGCVAEMHFQRDTHIRWLMLDVAV